jgi:hypothetical protein
MRRSKGGRQSEKDVIIIVWLHAAAGDDHAAVRICAGLRCVADATTQGRGRGACRHGSTRGIVRGRMLRVTAGTAAASRPNGSIETLHGGDSQWVLCGFDFCCSV